ncbi:hypothetical protein BESB_080200 [Besnoitia besnoiti]|uniref:Rab-GAP TBC domain-containing protein n=1 Tax=Besnoitia besnoiti TaxID=94643 RepID=A0A2A9M9C7_BESBE|nr:hypothetical protein BESB_080200 [Besnoitia besnoiti]PFH33804.1 hypothetical protein BESB_080200 [Besnoitia besnoiti]
MDPGEKRGGKGEDGEDQGAQQLDGTPNNGQAWRNVSAPPESAGASSPARSSPLLSESISPRLATACFSPCPSLQLSPSSILASSPPLPSVSSSSPAASSTPPPATPSESDALPGPDAAQVVERLRKEKAEATEIFAETLSRYDEEIRFLKAQLAAATAGSRRRSQASRGVAQASGSAKAPASMSHRRSSSSLSFVFSSFHGSSASSESRQRGSRKEDADLQPVFFSGSALHSRQRKKATSLSAPSSCFSLPEGLPACTRPLTAAEEDLNASPSSSASGAWLPGNSSEDARTPGREGDSPSLLSGSKRVERGVVESPDTSTLAAGSGEPMLPFSGCGEDLAQLPKSQPEAAGADAFSAASAGSQKSGNFLPLARLRTSGSKSGIAPLSNKISHKAAKLCAETVPRSDAAAAEAEDGARCPSTADSAQSEGVAKREERGEVHTDAIREDASPKPSLQRMASRMTAAMVAKKFYGIGRRASGLYQSATHSAADLSRSSSSLSSSASSRTSSSSSPASSSSSASPFLQGAPCGEGEISAADAARNAASRSENANSSDAEEASAEPGEDLTRALSSEAPQNAHNEAARAAEQPRGAKLLSLVAETGSGRERGVEDAAPLLHGAVRSAGAASQADKGEEGSAFCLPGEVESPAKDEKPLCRSLTTPAASSSGEAGERGSSGGVSRSWRTLLFSRDKSAARSSSSLSGPSHAGGVSGAGGVAKAQVARAGGVASGFSFAGSGASKRRREKGDEEIAQLASRFLRDPASHYLPSGLRFRGARSQRSWREEARGDSAIDASVLSTATWIDVILPDWSKQRGSARFNKLLHAGVPHDVRGEVWKKAVGDQLHITPRLYELLLKRVQHVRSFLMASSRRYRDRINETMRADQDESSATSRGGNADRAGEKDLAEGGGQRGAVGEEASEKTETNEAEGAGCEEDNPTPADRDAAVSAEGVEGGEDARSGTSCPQQEGSRQSAEETQLPSAERDGQGDDAPKGQDGGEGGGSRILSSAFCRARCTCRCSCEACKSCSSRGTRSPLKASPSSSAFACCACGFFNWEPDVFSAFQTIAMDLHRTLPRLGACKARPSPQEPSREEARATVSREESSGERSEGDQRPGATESEAERCSTGEKTEEAASRTGREAKEEGGEARRTREEEAGNEPSRQGSDPRHETYRGEENATAEEAGGELLHSDAENAETPLEEKGNAEAGAVAGEEGSGKDEKTEQSDALSVKDGKAELFEKGSKGAGDERRERTPFFSFVLLPKESESHESSEGVRGSADVKPLDAAEAPPDPPESKAKVGKAREDEEEVCRPLPSRVIAAKSAELVDKQAVQPVPFGVPASHMMYEYLRCVLEAYVMFRPDVGYVQGMAYLAGAFLLYMDEYSAFVCLCNLLLRRSLQAFYTFDMAVVDLYFRSFDALMEEKLPHVAARFAELGINSDIFLVEWMYTLFTRCLPFEIVGRVWDLFLVEGDTVLFQTSLAILAYFQDELENGTLENCMAIVSSSTTTHFQAMDENRFFSCFHGLALTGEQVEAVMDRVAGALSRQRHQQQASRHARGPSQPSPSSASQQRRSPLSSAFSLASSAPPCGSSVASAASAFSFTAFVSHTKPSSQAGPSDAASRQGAEATAEEAEGRSGEADDRARDPSGGSGDPGGEGDGPRSPGAAAASGEAANAGLATSGSNGGEKEERERERGAKARRGDRFLKSATTIFW